MARCYQSIKLVSQRQLMAHTNTMFNFETCPTFNGSLTNVKFLRLGHFLRNYKGQSHETWVMHTS